MLKMEEKNPVDPVIPSKFSFSCVLCFSWLKMGCFGAHGELLNF